jgi:hypothetical protein
MHIFATFFPCVLIVPIVPIVQGEIGFLFQKLTSPIVEKSGSYRGEIRKLSWRNPEAIVEKSGS